MPHQRRRTNSYPLARLCPAQHRICTSTQALQLIVRQWEEVPALSGTALGLLIKYLLNHPNPLAIVSAYLMAIRAEVVHRFKVRPTAQLEEALAKLQQVQVSGVLERCCPGVGLGTRVGQ